MNLNCTETAFQRLPESFAKQFGNKLEKTCYLQAPMSEIHPVALVKEGGELLFKHGWDEFVERYSIGCGNFINFEYKGNSKFNVSIFDLTACEISYDGDGGSSSSRMQSDDTDDDSEYFGPENLSPLSENETSFDEEDTEMSNEDDEIMSEESCDMSDTGVPGWMMKTYLKELKCIAAAGIPMPKNPFFVALMASFAFKKTSAFWDLKSLNNLSGSLQIVLRQYLEDPASEAKEANLISKHALADLSIDMKEICFHYDSKQHDEAVLEGLKPHQNLKKLEIIRYGGEEFPSWAMGDSLCITLPNLVEIRLVGVDECTQVPCFSQLPFLKRLTLWILNNVEYIEKTPPPSAITFFPSLEELVLSCLDNLKGWWEETKVVDFSDEETLSQPPSTQCHPLSPSFSGLTKLKINRCPGLVSFPVSPNVEELLMKGVKKELNVLQKVTNVGGSGDVGSSKLKSLEIDDVEVLISMPVERLGHLTSLEIDWDNGFKNTTQLASVFKHLSSLTSLKILTCHNLTSISVGMEHLVSLETLTIDMSRNLDVGESMPWTALTSLRTLKLVQLDDVKHLPSGLQHLPNLRHLLLSSLPNLEEIPEWIGCLSRLDAMELKSCYKLKRLPPQMRTLTNLNQLLIRGCAGLTKRCEGPDGADWPSIRHIPNLTVQDHFI